MQDNGFIFNKQQWLKLISSFSPIIINLDDHNKTDWYEGCTLAKSICCEVGNGQQVVIILPMRIWP